jgi:hypothetical protein
VKTSDAAAAARRYLRPDHYVQVIAGDTKTAGSGGADAGR